MSCSINWIQPATIQPTTAVQALAVDYNQRLLLLHRGPNIRSAKNVWSFPTGLHDIGETIYECAARELKEETGLEAKRAAFITLYENIAGDEGAEKQFHWVMVMVACLVADVTLYQNLEPDKHDELKIIDYQELNHAKFFQSHKFHKSFEDHARLHGADIVRAIEGFLR